MVDYNITCDYMVTNAGQQHTIVCISLLAFERVCKTSHHHYGDHIIYSNDLLLCYKINFYLQNFEQKIAIKPHDEH